ncbi:methylmalonyl-CoA mutase subunit beta [Gaetbulibacter saemankumensis]|uniref:methylmalonyl-CoA mutase subunit beta n=1 Tax=Gaetbulibacter saemankumensis TaxID=311208 RepID=UPI000408B892|nr:methylmalonyl-CoA mutase subunit beta [Gaetbulibacter saemankumensis]
MSKNLFSEFNPVSAKQWKQKIQFDLKGVDYNEALIWNSNEDIDVKPFYHRDGIKTPVHLSNTNATNWKICQTIYVSDVSKSNETAINAIHNGAESLKFIIPNNNILLQALLNDINLNEISIFFDLHFLDLEYTNQILAFQSEAGIFVNLDIIGNLARSGNFYDNFRADFNNYNNIVSRSKTISINVDLYQNAGATMVQQLAYGLAHVNEYLNYSEHVVHNTNQETLKIIFNVAIGSNYFFEIAKLRALKQLWNTLADEYKLNNDCIIFSIPSKRNKTIYDANTNMLRTTTECMSAILGGSDYICNLPYDAPFKKDHNFSARIARNQLLILKNESYFNKVKNPVDGAYYIETLTEQLAQKALDLFKDIENNGGFLKQLKNGTIQRKIKESANKEQQLFDKEIEVLVGTNKYPNSEESINEHLEIYPFVKTIKRKTLIEPVIEKRLSEILEQNRLKNEN